MPDSAILPPSSVSPRSLLGTALWAICRVVMCGTE